MADMITLELTPDECTILFNALARQPYLIGDAAVIAPIINKINEKRPKEPAAEGEIVT